MSIRLVRSIAGAALVAVVLTPVAGRAEDIVKVELDQAKMFRLAAPASTIIIGNPAIADATLQDAQTLIITGHAYGQTNLIVLDDQGETITDTQLAVLSASNQLVTVYKGIERQSLSCLPECQPAAVPGDTGSHYSSILGQVAQHNGAGASTSADATAVVATTTTKAPSSQ